MSNEIYVWGIVIISWVIGLWIVYSLAKENDKLTEEYKESGFVLIKELNKFIEDLEAKEE